MATFAETLRALCLVEVRRSFGKPNASADLVTALLEVHAEVLALSVAGDPRSSAALARNASEALSPATAQKSELIRLAMQGLEGTAH